MKAGSKYTATSSGFTLVEIMVSLAVLGLLIAALAQVLSIATSTTINGRKHMDADSQARLIFDRMADDFSKMVKRPDVDYIFYKNAAGGATGANDAMYFYSESPSYDSTVSTTAQNSVSLVGYRINSSYQLERLGGALTRTGVTSTSAPGSVIFCAYNSVSNSGVTPTPASTLDGIWNSTTGGATYNIGTYSAAGGAYSDGTNTNYRAIGEETFRFEINFQLTDGSVSTMPVLGLGSSPTPSNWPTVVPAGATAAPTFAHSGTVDPDSTINGNITAATYYAVGSRWYNTTTSRGYICTSATPTKTVWAPIGTQDIAAVIVGLGILDNNSRKLVNNTMLGNMVGSLPDAANSTLIAKTWGSSNYLTTTGVPAPAAEQIRIYQRYFYLNNQ